MDWIWLIVALLVGLAVGGIVAWTVMKRRYGDRESVVELRNELDRYRGKVTEHFVETADLVNTLTRNYKRVYDHLESGAYELVGEETLRRELDAPAEAPVMLEYLGQRRSDEPAASVAPSRDDPQAGATPAASTSSSVETEGSGPQRTASAPTAGAAATANGESSAPEDDGAPSEEAHASDADERTRSAG